ncbi:unnamed protein product, partial [Brassica oleracea]
LSVPTTKTFLRRFIQAAKASDKVPHIEMESLANYVAVLTVVEYSFLRLMPSLIAASAVFFSKMDAITIQNPTLFAYVNAITIQNPTLKHYTRYETPALKNTLNTSGSTLVAIRKKYNQEKIFCIPDIVPEDPVADEGYDEATEQRNVARTCM